MRILKDFVIWPKIAVYDIELAPNWGEVIMVCHVDEY